MKFSLKYKLPIFILLGFALFITTLAMYYRLFLMDNLGKDFDLFKDRLYRVMDKISKRLEKDYQDRKKIAQYLEVISATQHTKITIYDVSGNKIAGADRLKEYGGLTLELKNFTVVGQDTIYVVELVSPFTMDNFGELNSYRKVRDMGEILLGLMLVLLMVYLHFSMARPLVILNRGLEKFDYRSQKSGLEFKIPPRFYKRHDELGELTRKFVAMQQRLSAAHREQTEMMASISHDLKTPLTSIIGFLERMMSQKLPEQRQAEYQQIIYQKARDISQLITEFNEYAMSDLGGEATGGKDTVNLQEFFETLCAEYTAELKEKGFECICLYEAGDDLWLEIDVQGIRRVFANLVSNSLKYADKLTKITLRCKLQDEFAVFTVEDDGPGVPSGELEAIFTKFYRVDKSRSRQKGGSGLGLAICQRIIENHQGTIRAYLPFGGGFGVSLTLPVKRIL